MCVCPYWLSDLFFLLPFYEIKQSQDVLIGNYKFEWQAAIFQILLSSVPTPNDILSATRISG